MTTTIKLSFKYDPEIFIANKRMDLDSKLMGRLLLIIGQVGTQLNLESTTTYQIWSVPDVLVKTAMLLDYNYDDRAWNWLLNNAMNDNKITPKWEKAQADISRWRTFRRRKPIKVESKSMSGTIYRVKSKTNSLNAIAIVDVKTSQISVKYLTDIIAPQALSGYAPANLTRTVLSEIKTERYHGIVVNGVLYTNPGTRKDQPFINKNAMKVFQCKQVVSKGCTPEFTAQVSLAMKYDVPIETAAAMKQEV